MVEEIQKKYYKQANISRAAHPTQKTNDLKQLQQLLQRQDTTQ
jgi:hypothetical protein